MEPPDFPAAHSMDTTWFAVDKHGQVGIFISGSMGAVPNAYANIFADADIATPMFEAGLQRPNSLFKTWLEHPFMHNGKPTTLDKFPDFISDCLARLAPQAKRVPGEYFTCPEGDFTSLYFSKDEAIQTWNTGMYSHFWAGIQAEYLLGCAVYSPNEKWTDWIAGPYESHAVPQNLLKFRDLPDGIFDFPPLKLNSYDFAKDRIIQPAEIVSCAVWGVTADSDDEDDRTHSFDYLSSDKKTVRPISPRHPISPAREDDLRKAGLSIGPAIPLDDTDEHDDDGMI